MRLFSGRAAPFATSTRAASRPMPESAPLMTTTRQVWSGICAVVHEPGEVVCAWTRREPTRYRHPVIFPTPDDRLVDARGRLTFLWDVDITREEFEEHLRDPDPLVRGYWIGKLLRQAKPDDVPRFVRVPDLAADWAHFERFLGRSRDMWAWLLKVGWTGE